MKNWEFHEEEVKEYDFIFGMKDNKIYSCRELDCPECAFYRPKCSCNELTMEWLYQEHKDPVILTDDEKKLCELLKDGWIARSENGVLCHYRQKPHKNELTGSWYGRHGSYITLSFPQCKFDFIKWEDEEPWEVNVND